MKQIIHRLMIGNKSKVLSNGYKMNIVAGAINSFKSIIFLLIVSKNNDFYGAGIITIAFAIANLLVNIGKFGMRSYQVTDVENIHEFPTYFYSRITTSLLMLLSILIYIVVNIIFNDYSLEKATIIVCICIIFVTESIEDVFSGYYQQRGRLDVGSRLLAYRWITIIVLFSGVFILTKNLVLASSASTVFSIICVSVLTKITICDFFQDTWVFNKKKINQLLIRCFPLFLSAFITVYLTNAPKYAIDIYLKEEIQAYYGFVSMPIFVIILLAGFIYQPQLIQLSQDWTTGKIDKFLCRAHQHYVVILGISIVCFIGAYVLGIPVLSAFYSVDLEPYSSVLMVIMISAGFLALINYLTILLTIMRAQKLLLLGNGVVSIFALFFMGYIVRNHGVLGASLFYLFLMVVLSAILLVTFRNVCNQKLVHLDLNKKQ